MSNPSEKGGEDYYTEEDARKDAENGLRALVTGNSLEDIKGNPVLSGLLLDRVIEAKQLGAKVPIKAAKWAGELLLQLAVDGRYVRKSTGRGRRKVGRKAKLKRDRRLIEWIDLARKYAGHDVKLKSIYEEVVKVYNAQSKDDVNFEIVRKVYEKETKRRKQ